METARMIKKISFHASCFFSFNTLTFIKKSYRNKKDRLERKRLFRSAMMVTESAKGRFQKAYGLAQPN